MKKIIWDNSLWISWERHRRNHSIISRLGVKLYELTYDGSSVFRYPVLLVKTANLLCKERPDILFVQNPSIVLSFFCTILYWMLRKKIIIDAHNIGVFFEHKNRTVQTVGQIVNVLIMKFASLTIVTNDALAQFVYKKKGKPFILPDPIPHLIPKSKIKLRGGKNILFICTFSQDEPYRQVINALGKVSKDIFMYVTGHCPSELLQNSPNNVIFTGFLPEQKYVDYLYSVDLVIDLTLRRDCLVCGAYEALAANKPQILSDTSVLKEFFGEAALYTKHDSKSISKNIIQAFKKISIMRMKIEDIRRKKNLEWSVKENELKQMMLED